MWFGIIIATIETYSACIHSILDTCSLYHIALIPAGFHTGFLAGNDDGHRPVKIWRIQGTPPENLAEG